jgi:peptidyl-dipeptidase A
MIRAAIDRARRAGVAALLASLSVLPAGFASAETADEFVARLNKGLAAIGLESAAAGWTQGTYITVDTQLLNARANERFLEAFSAAVAQARKFDGQPMSPSSRRALDLLRLGVSAPAPDDPLKRAELAKLAAGMEAKYGSATWCPQGPESCRNEIQLKQVLEQSRD